MPIRRRPVIALASSLALVVGACGGGNDESIDTIAAAENVATPTTADAPPPLEDGAAADTPDADAATAAPEPAPDETAADADPPAPAGPNDLPAVVVRDIATGDEVDLSAFAPGELPFVVWFWAPH